MVQFMDKKKLSKWDCAVFVLCLDFLVLYVTFLRFILLLHTQEFPPGIQQSAKICAEVPQLLLSS